MHNQMGMIFPQGGKLPVIDVPEGYTVRTFREGDEKSYIDLLNDSDLGKWDHEKLNKNILGNVLSPDGIFFVIYNGKPVATACSLDREQQTGMLSWVAVAQEHRGKKLGSIVCTEAVKYLQQKDYKNILLNTDHWRKAAIKTYLNIGFEPVVNTPDLYYIWQKTYKEFGMNNQSNMLNKKHISGEEIAYRTLMRERISEPCIVASECMKREYFVHMTKQNDIYLNAPDTVIKAFVLSGANLCLRFLMPSPVFERDAYSPFKVGSSADSAVSEQKSFLGDARTVRDYIENLPYIDTLENDYDVDSEAEKYASVLIRLKSMSEGEILFLSGFGQADFKDIVECYGSAACMETIESYPDHMKRYFEYTAESGRLFNKAIARAVEKYKLAPFVYGGQDICSRCGPSVSTDILYEFYFPALKKAVAPLHEAGIRIIWHGEGDIRPITDILSKEIEVEGFRGFQEETGSTLEYMSSIKTIRGDPMLLLGSISVSNTLLYGTVENVKNDVERCFNITAGRGFALASSGLILPETSLDNIIAMYEHGFEYGRRILKE
jgi:ribosomal protein S18 acetylase RimI-like enzyme